ncbi:MAG: Gfo/Idh/MocA family oxidoreductase [Puniceicoccales bacterium]|jgi:predicted dehydrogenase|nr:Gfo/Idh/MocA family oxidoreductase [Puniceicoccales bacterium]
MPASPAAPPAATQTTAVCAVAPPAVHPRREFLRQGALAAAGLLILPAGFLRGQNAPSNRLNIAAVGVGGMGRGDVRGITNCKGTRLVGLCDADAGRLDAALDDHRDAFPDVRGFKDFREMFAQLGKQIDAVSVSTPDHTHFSAAYAAAQLGKHLYVQKPICHTFDQTRRLAAKAKEMRLVAQMGNQGASSTHTRVAREWYEAGLLGEVSEVVSWTNRPRGGGWPQGMTAFAPTTPVPAGLDWELWLGPAAARPYCPETHPFKWRAFYDFGVGALGDMGTHLMFDAFYALGLGAPSKIEAEIPAPAPSAVAFPKQSKITFYFPAAAGRGPVKYVWLDGGGKPAAPAGVGELAANGTLLFGKKMTLAVSGWANESFPCVSPSERAAIKRPPAKYPRVKGGHYQNWVDAIRKGTPLASPFDIAAPFTEAVLLGVIAQRLGRTLEWDAAAAKFPNDAEASALLAARNPRAGFYA